MPRRLTQPPHCRVLCLPTEQRAITMGGFWQVLGGLSGAVSIMAGKSRRVGIFEQAGPAPTGCDLSLLPVLPASWCVCVSCRGIWGAWAQPPRFRGPTGQGRGAVLERRASECGSAGEGVDEGRLLPAAALRGAAARAAAHASRQCHPPGGGGVLRGRHRVLLGGAVRAW